MQTPVFPKTIPQPRGNRAQYATGFISSAILIAGSLCTRNKLLYLWTSGFLFIIYIHLAELCFRLALLFEERHHFKSRYNSSFMTLLTDAFTFSRCSTCLTVLSTFCISYTYFEYGDPSVLFHSFGAASNVCAFVSTILASRIFNLAYGPLYQSILITKLTGLDYGSAMAYTFFYGYLQIVLPAKGTEEKGMKEQMQDYESTHGIKFEFHKLLVLIPLSLYSPVNIEDCSGIVKEAASMADVVRTRAGVLNRVYKNSVYKTKDKYVCAEYATPLQTLHDIVSHNSAHAKYYKKHSKELVLQFYLTLRNILRDNPDCGNYCELLFFDDNDDEGNRIDVGHVILNHLKQIKAAEKKKRAYKLD